MIPFTEIVGLCWLLFLLYWIVSAFTSKKNISRSRGAGFRILGFVIIVIFLNTALFQSLNLENVTFSFPLMEPLGILFVIFGLALAIWARRCIGRNWGMPMSVQENAEMVTSGPYAYIRNPIYSGVLLAMLGSLLVVGLSWLIPSIFSCLYFIYCAKAEEKLMLKQFPNTYPAYKRRTKMLIPYVL